VQIVTFRTDYSQNLYAHAKFRCHRLNGFGNISNFRFTIWRPSAILNFLKYSNFNFPHCLRPQSAYSRKIASWSAERLQRYSKFSISNMAAVRHLVFVVRMRVTMYDVLFVVFIIVQNLVEIGSVVLIISKFNNFCDLAGNCLFTPLLEQFWGNLTP